MKTLSKLLFGVLLAFAPALTGSASATENTLVLEKFFIGNLSAKGAFTNVWTGNTRGLTVEMKGRWSGTTLELLENFT